jgi:hypothetical protein
MYAYTTHPHKNLKGKGNKYSNKTKQPMEIHIVYILDQKKINLT